MLRFSATCRPGGTFKTMVSLSQSLRPKSICEGTNIRTRRRSRQQLKLRILARRIVLLVSELQLLHLNQTEGLGIQRISRRLIRKSIAATFHTYSCFPGQEGAISHPTSAHTHSHSSVRIAPGEHPPEQFAVFCTGLYLHCSFALAAGSCSLSTFISNVSAIRTIRQHRLSLLYSPAANTSPATARSREILSCTIQHSGGFRGGTSH